MLALVCLRDAPYCSSSLKASVFMLQQSKCTSQDELPPQQEMRLGGVNGFLPYHAVATMMYSAMGPPPSEAEITGLRNRYLDKFLPSRRSKPPVSGPASSSFTAATDNAGGSSSDVGAGQPASLQFGYCPIVDLSVPSQPLCAYHLRTARAHTGSLVVTA